MNWKGALQMESIGRKKEVTVTVTEEMLACHVGSGDVKVFATPMMIALMEQAASLCLSVVYASTFTTILRVVSAAPARTQGICASCGKKMANAPLCMARRAPFALCSENAQSF